MDKDCKDWYAYVQFNSEEGDVQVPFEMVFVNVEDSTNYKVFEINNLLTHIFASSEFLQDISTVIVCNEQQQVFFQEIFENVTIMQDSAMEVAVKEALEFEKNRNVTETDRDWERYQHNCLYGGDYSK